MADLYSPDKVMKAIDQLPRQSTARVKQLRDTAVAQKLPSLVEACDAELARRPYYDLDATDAEKLLHCEEESEGMSLSDAVRYAFTTFRPATDYEVKYLRWQADHPGGSYAEALEAYGKGDLALAIGHLVYDRYGVFRRFLRTGEEDSSVLLERSKGKGSVRYTIRPEVERVLREIGVI